MLVTRKAASVATASGRRAGGGAWASTRPLAYNQGGSIRNDIGRGPPRSSLSGQQVTGQSGGQGHDRQLRAEGRRRRHRAAVADVQALRTVDASIAVQDAGARVGGHAR